MEVILLEDVAGVGNRGDKVKVKDGYARNFMIPNKMAISAKGAGAKVFAEVERQRARREHKVRREAEDNAKKFADTSVHIQMEVGEEDRIFGSVASMIRAEDLRVPWLAWGDGVNPGSVVGRVEIADTAPSVLSLLGIEAPSGWTGVDRLRD